MTGHSEIGCKETTDRLVLQSIDGSFKRQRASSLVDARDLFTRGFLFGTPPGRNKQTRQNMNLHLHSSNFTVYQKGTYYMAIKIYNSLPTQIIETAYDPKQFRKNLKSFLDLNSFYTLQEYFNHDK
jgi:hypothetical protein